MSQPTSCSRRALLTSGGAAAGALALCACGSGGGADSAAGAKGGTLGTPVPTSSIPVGGGKVFGDARVVVTQPSAGDFKGFSAVCTHAGCIVAMVVNGAIVCGCHGSEFDIATGAVRQGPATRPLPARTVTVSGSDLTVA